MGGGFVLESNPHGRLFEIWPAATVPNGVLDMALEHLESDPNFLKHCEGWRIT